MDSLRRMIPGCASSDIKAFDAARLRPTATKVTKPLNIDIERLESRVEPGAVDASEQEGGSWVGGFLASNTPEARADHDAHLAGLQAAKLPNKGFAIQLEQVLSREECQYLIDRCEAKGFEPALLNVGYGRQILDTDTRNNLRCIHDDKELCNELWRRLEPHLANIARSDRFFQGQKHQLRPRELNERLRVLKYTSEKGNPNYFRAHCDGSYPRPKSHPHYPDISRFTVLLYLNGGIQGGSTRLYRNQDSEFYDCNPAAGRVLVHDHAILHEGMPVVEGTGTKYVIRTDVMCTIPDTPSDLR
jgi:hypothetical protein